MQPFEAHLERPFKLLAGDLDLLVFVGEAQQRSWNQRGLRARRERVIQNGIDLARFAPASGLRDRARAELGLSQDAFVLGMVAGFRTEKRHGDVIRALSAARRQGSPAILIAVGDGPTRPEAQALAQSLGLDSAIRFVGEKSDVGPYLAAADIGVLSSSVETFPLTAIEFLAAGRPILTSEVSGALEVIPERNRLTHAVGDIGRLAFNIREAQRPEIYEQLSGGAREAAERFSEHRMIAAYAEELQRLFDGGR
jgi:glycosyltransferase involved in cell wall biosynthesis